MGRGFDDLKQLRDELAAREQEQEKAPEKAPLNWTQAYQITSGYVTATISAAVGDRGDKLYSFTFARQGKEPGRTSKFFQPKDMKDLDRVLLKVIEWLNEDKAKNNAQ